MQVNEESLRRANAFLAAVAEQVQAGEALNVTPADIGKKIGLPDPLAAARAVRALLARRRLEIANGSYRLVDPRPLQPGEPEAVPRPPRRKRAAAGRRGGEPGRLTFSEVGRSAIERLIDLGREVGTLRGNLRTAREEVRAAREAKDVAERQAQSMSGRIRDLEAKLEMAESNLRTILTAARGTAARADSVGDAEMDAILAVLKGDAQSPPA
jgi:signal transduction histidine kinase